nr:MAG TPA_asm: hypothetical protein [Caudoviricetes sp.]
MAKFSVCSLHPSTANPPDRADTLKGRYCRELVTRPEL